MTKEQKYCVVGTNTTRKVRKCISLPYDTKEEAEERCEIKKRVGGYIYVKVAKYPYKEKTYRKHE